LVDAYRRPTPQLELGQRLAPMVSAMMDISDGLLIDAKRLAEASGVAVIVESIDVPLSQTLVEVLGDSRETSVTAATSGDDYELLFTAPRRSRRAIETVAEELSARIQCVGLIERGEGLMFQEGGRPLPLPQSLGWAH
jgi:thiamine-monophosphate kinase